jgi:hypothetical protein
MVIVLAIVLFGGSLLLYARSLGFGFIGYDEDAVLLGHPNLYGQASFAASLREILVGYFPREEPLIVRDLTWLVDSKLFGFGKPLGYHLGNVLLHGANVVLLFAFLLHATRKLALAGMVAGLFSLLAVHVEPVSWVMGRKDLLGAFFTLLALLLQSIALRQTSTSRRRILLLLVFFLCPIAILSKFSAIVLVLVLAVHRLYAPYLDGARSPGEPLRLRSRLPDLAWLLPHLAASVMLYFWYQRILSAFHVIGGRGPSPLSLEHLRTLAVLAPLALGYTLGHLFSVGELAISYLRPSVALPLLPGEIGMVLLVVVGSLASLWLTLRRRRDLAFFVLSFFLFMLPYANVEYIGIWVADRYAYLSSLCVLVVLVEVVLGAWRSQRATIRRLAVVGFAVLVVLAGRNLRAGQEHQRAFSDPRSFWDHEISRAQPAMLAFDSFVKTAISEAAAAKPDSPERARAIARARAGAERGLLYYRSLPWKPSGSYFSRERSHAADLLTSLGLAATLAGGTPEERLAYHRLAYDMMPSQQTALMLAQTLFDMARKEPPDARLALESLHYFGLYLREAKSDPLRRRGLPRLLRQYVEAFPALSGEVDRVAEESLR